MNANTRACIAAAAGCLISGIEYPSVYDYHQSKYISIDGTVSEDSVHLFDYDRQCYFTGVGVDGSYSLHDFGDDSRLCLDIVGNEFSGVDFESGNHYSGYVNQGYVALFDHGKRQYFKYSV